MTEPGAASEDDALRAEFERREARIRAMRNPAEAAEAAQQLGREMAAFRTRAARLREDMARRMRDEQGMSLQAIADRLGISKGTAQNLLGKKPKRRPRHSRSDEDDDR